MTTKVSQFKLKYVIIALGVVLAGTAPFVHMLFPKYSPEQTIVIEKTKNGEITHEEYEIIKKEWRKSHFGFKTTRNLLNALGFPTSVLIISLIFLSSIVHINHKETRITLIVSASLLLAIAFYFIIWVFFPRGDLPKPAYYVALATGAITSTVISYFFIAQNKVLVYIDNFRKLTRFIYVVKDKYVPEDAKDEYVEDIIKVTDTLKN